MSDGVQIALIVLLALLVGSLLPVMISAHSLIKQARQTLVVVEERSLTLTQNAEELLTKADQIAEDVQKELPTLQRTAQRVDELGGSIETLTETVRKIQAAGNIVGPAIAAGLNAYRTVKQAQTNQAASSDDLPEAVTDAILAEIKSKAKANGDLPAADETDTPADATSDDA